MSCKYCERTDCDTDCGYIDRHLGLPRKTAAELREEGAAEVRDLAIKAEIARHETAVKLIDAEMQRDIYKHYVQLLCDSMHPHPKEHPTMHAAKEAALQMLANPPKTQGS